MTISTPEGYLTPGVWTPEKKALGLAALRSGNFTQQRNCLRGPHVTTLCCIGVMDRVSGNVDIDDMNISASTPRAVKRLGLEYVMVPPDALHAKKLSGAVHEDAGSWLMALNDTYRLNFDEIADVMEKHL